MKQKDCDRLIQIIAEQAEASDDCKDFFKNITFRANLPREWTVNLGWSGTPRKDARNLIQWASSKGINNQDNTFHTLGSILYVLLEQVGSDIGREIFTFILRYQLCNSEKILKELTQEFPLNFDTNRKEFLSDSSYKLTKQLIINRLMSSPIYLLEKSLENQNIKRIPRNFSFYRDKTKQVYANSQLNMTVIKKFNDIGKGRRMLILGESGSGKTTLLNRIFCEWIDLAGVNDNQYSIPFIINISLWNGRTEIKEWFIEELLLVYDIPKKISNQLLINNEILFLLDGLNELKKDYCNLCIAQLNNFCRNELYLSTEIVLCSQRHAYQQLNQKLGTGFCSIVLEKLSSYQIEKYLQSFDLNLAKKVVTSPTLLNLAETPLMLNLLKDCYTNNPNKMNIIPEEQEREFYLEFYIQEMLKNNKIYPKMERWLMWLAFQMENSNQTSFFVDAIQPNWLGSSSKKYTYPILFRSIIGLIVGVIMGLISLLMNDKLSVIEALTSGIISGIISGLTTGLISKKMKTHYKKNFKNLTIFSYSIIKFLKNIKIIKFNYFNDIMFKTNYIILYGFISTAIFSMVTFFNPELFSPLGSLAFGLIFSVIFERVEVINSNVEPLESIEWFWSKFFKSSIFGIFFGLGIGLINTIFIIFYKTVVLDILEINSLACANIKKYYILKSRYIENVLCNIENINEEKFIFFLVFGTLALCVFVALIFGVLLATEKITTSRKIIGKINTNQRIMKSVSNSIILIRKVGTSIAIIFWVTWFIASINNQLMWWVVYGTANLYNGVLFGIIAALSIGLIAGLIGGGNSGLICIQHFILRLIIYLNDYSPWDYNNFLEYAVKINLLKNETSSYKFFHTDIQRHLSIKKKR
ncbi:NACHT domain-containing protein [Nodularia spumigena CS-591/04]|uniref:NACHT domain-containing protein n=1 Tax=Nodularia spumigena TaxID=70799 RepID=UPI00232A9062|nr:NACHT domain-containing protein [Nodularia spumigena]MDB9322327.1 NACHT domain-containing protein [Nodularia spumigena CS-591/07A]MDB9330888.1 NACHT domain-containing protein [Nodularia spumigena CS-591/04]MDB9360193.1 NACHT domain-containing protein [Nodularia spumigena CS-588/02]